MEESDRALLSSPPLLLRKSDSFFFITRFQARAAPEVEQSPQVVELSALLSRVQPAVLLQHPGGRERA